MSQTRTLMEIFLKKLHFSWAETFVVALKRCDHLEWLANEIHEKCRTAQNPNDTDSVKKFSKSNQFRTILTSTVIRTKLLSVIKADTLSYQNLTREMLCKEISWIFFYLCMATNLCGRPHSLRILFVEILDDLLFYRIAKHISDPIEFGIHLGLDFGQEISPIYNQLSPNAALVSLQMMIVRSTSHNNKLYCTL